MGIFRFSSKNVFAQPANASNIRKRRSVPAKIQTFQSNPLFFSREEIDFTQKYEFPESKTRLPSSYDSVKQFEFPIGM